MVAAILAGFGVLSRDHSYDVTLEDREFLHLLTTKDTRGLAAAITARNRASRVWAFKVPSIHGYLEHGELRQFRNPHLLIVVRDLVSTAFRHAVSEYMDAAELFFEAARGQHDLICFLEATACPTLLISYEKGVRHPEKLIPALGRFCAIPIDDPGVQRLAELIRPESEDYIHAASRRFEGNIDGVFGGTLVGWCREVGESHALPLDVLVDGVPACQVTADQHRTDLQAAGIGDGRHGFAANIAALGISPEAVLTVRISGRTFELPGSRQPVRSLER